MQDGANSRDMAMVQQLCRVLILPFLIVCLSSPAELHSQDTPDLDAQIEKYGQLSFDSLSRLYNSYLKTDIDSAAFITDVIMSKAEFEDNIEEMLYAHNCKAVLYSHIADNKKAAKQIEEALAVSKQLDKHEMMVLNTHFHAGFIYSNSRMLVKSLSSYYDALSGFESLHDTLAQAQTYNNIGNIYLSVESYTAAREHLERSSELYDSIFDHDADGNLWLNIGKVDLKLGRYHEAIVSLDKAAEIYKASNEVTSLVYCLIYKGEAYDNLGVGEKSLQLYTEAVALADSLNYTRGILAANPLLAEKSISIDIREAENLIMDAQMIADDKKSNEVQAMIYDVLHKIEKAKGNHEQSLTMYELYSQYRDSTIHDNNEAALLKEELERTFDKRLGETAALYEDQTIALKSSQRYKLAGVLLGGLLLLTGGYWFSRRKLSAQHSEQVSLLAEVEQLKLQQRSAAQLQQGQLILDRAKIESKIAKSINDTDWKVMNILLEDPVITNKGIAEKAYLSVDGIGSSLRRMYKTFDIKESRYMKVALIMELMKISR